MRKLPVLRASSTARWLNCTFFSANEWPEGASSEAAERGTRVHNTIASALGHKNDGEKARDEDEAALATVGVNYAEALMDGVSGWTKYVEQEMRWVGGYEDEIKGTADLILVNPEGTYALLVDWKTGQRHGAYEDQMRTYAWLLSWSYKNLQSVDVRVVYLASGEEDRVVVTAEQIKEHSERMMVAVSRRSEEQPEATPGHWCQWCPGEVSCPKNAALAKAINEASLLQVDVRKLATSVDNEDEAMAAHALINYATEVIATIESRLKIFVRENGPVRTRDGRSYGFAKAERQNLTVIPSALDAIVAAGAEDVLRPAASWAEIKKKLARNAVALENLESTLRASGALKTVEYERWTTK
jgi:hypothetical protein